MVGNLKERGQTFALCLQKCDNLPLADKYITDCTIEYTWSEVLIKLHPEGY